MPTDDIVTVVAFIMVVLIAAILTRFLPKKRRGTATPNVVVDGSNVMHWGGDPSAMVLRRVIASIQERGQIPIVFFDANVGYKLADRYLDDVEMARMIGVPADQVLVVEKGVVADDRILAVAKARDLPVISNDRFRDWRVAHPWVGKKGRMMRGTYKQGSVIWK